jgi:hypothetical protein
MPIAASNNAIAAIINNNVETLARNGSISPDRVRMLATANCRSAAKFASIPAPRAARFRFGAHDPAYGEDFVAEKRRSSAPAIRNARSFRRQLVDPFWRTLPTTPTIWRVASLTLILSLYNRHLLSDGSSLGQTSGHGFTDDYHSAAAGTCSVKMRPRSAES